MKGDMFKGGVKKDASYGRVKGHGVKNMDSRPKGRTSYVAGCKTASTDAK